MLLEVVVVWLVVSPVVGVALGLAIARAGRLAERHEPLPAVASVPVPVRHPAPVVPDAEASAATTVPQGPPPADAPEALTARPVLAVLADFPPPRPAPPLDGVIHLRLTSADD